MLIACKAQTCSCLALPTFTLHQLLGETASNMFSNRFKFLIKSNRMKVAGSSNNSKSFSQKFHRLELKPDCSSNTETQKLTQEQTARSRSMRSYQMHKSNMNFNHLLGKNYFQNTIIYSRSTKPITIVSISNQVIGPKNANYFECLR